MLGIVMRTEKQPPGTAVQSADHSVRRRDRTKIPTQLRASMKQRTEPVFDAASAHYNLDTPSRFGALSYTQEKRVDVGRGHQANESSVVKKVAIIQRIRNNVVQRCGSGEGGSNAFKFSEMTESKKAEIVEEYRKKAPIEIPDTAGFKAKSMAGGYEQISYKWNDGTYKYEVRWHTRTPGAPEGQGNTWVIQRTIPGRDGTKPSTQFMIGKNEWVEGWKWYGAITARKDGTATPEQMEMLDKGHWKE